MVVISTSAALPRILTPAAPLSVNAPAEVDRLEAPVASIETEDPSIVNAPELISTAPVVVISTSAELPTILTPVAPSSVNAPAEVDKLDAAPASKLNPVPASIVIAPSASISILEILDTLLLLAAIVNVLVAAALAVIVKLVESVPSIEIVEPSIVNSEELISIAPLDTIDKSVPFPEI